VWSSRARAFYTQQTTRKQRPVEYTPCRHGSTRELRESTTNTRALPLSSLQYPLPAIHHTRRSPSFSFFLVGFVRPSLFLLASLVRSTTVCPGIEKRARFRFGF
jgi:hypothetical protein